MAQIMIVEDNTVRITRIIRPQGGKGGLFLGSQKAASDIPYLKSLGINSVITIASELENKYPPSFSHLKIDLSDQPLAYIYEYLEVSYAFLSKQLMAGNVLVHCKMGISRSASLVIAYLMRKYKCGYLKAYNKVKEKRSIINPNEGFVMQLKQYEKAIVQLKQKK